MCFKLIIYNELSFGHFCFVKCSMYVVLGEVAIIFTRKKVKIINFKKSVEGSESLPQRLSLRVGVNHFPFLFHLSDFA